MVDLMSQVSAETRRAVRHQRYNQEDLRRDIGYGDSRRRLYGPEVNILSFSGNPRFGAVEGRIHFLANGPVEDYALSASMDTDGDIRVGYAANPAAHDPAEAAAHAARYAWFHERLAVDPTASIGHVELLPPQERHRLLVEWNTTEEPEDYDLDIVTRIRRVARATPDAMAAFDGHRRLDYASLTTEASALSRRLVDHDLRPGELCAVLTGRGVHVVTTMLGIWGAGGAYVPLDPQAPVDRNLALLADSRIRFIVADGANAARAGDFAGRLPTPARVIVLDAAADPDDDLLPPVPTTDEVAYVYFTSGSTGRPKGAMVHRHGMINHLVAKIDDLGMTADDSVVHSAPLTFDVSVWQMIAPLLTGGFTRIVDEDTAVDPFTLFELMAAEGVTILEVVPSFMRAALNGWRNGGDAAAAPTMPRFRWMIVNGEVLPPAMCVRWFEVFPHVDLINAYGTTECSDDVVHAVLTRDSRYDVTRVPIGPPLRNIRLYVLDDRLRPVPTGMPGELYVAGVGVGPGYVNDPARTAAVYLPDPFTSEAGARMYRTGDRVRYLTDGQLDFLGRRDFQVKIRGQRIDPGEVEAALRTADGVTDSVVVVRNGTDGHKFLVGYIAGTADDESVRAHIGRILPDYAIPSLLVSLPELPLNQNGKVDRKALPAVEDVRTTGATPPATPGEAVLCGIFAEVLGIGQVGVDESFFSLGGDSILSIEVVGRARKAGLTFTPRDMFELRTARALAARFETAIAETGTDHAAEATGDIPATPIMRFLAETGGPIAGVHQTTVVRVPPSNAEQVATAIQGIMDRHDVLRSTLHRGPLWSLEVPPAGAVSAQTVLRVLPAPDDGLDRAVHDEFTAARDWLDPDSGRMIRIVWFDGGTRPGRLLMVANHLVVDGVSWRILLADLAAAWTAGPDAVAAAPASFRHWAREQTVQAQLPHWAEELSTWQPPETLRSIATRRPDSTVDVAAGQQSITVELAPADTAPLLATVPAAFGADTQDILLASLAVALAETADGPVAIDLERHGRHDWGQSMDLSRTVGWFTSVVPVWFDIELNRAELGGTMVRAVKIVKERLRSLSADGIGYGLLRYLNPVTAPELANHHRSDVAFNYLGRMELADPSDERDWIPLADSWDLAEPGPDVAAAHALDIVAVIQGTGDDVRLRAVLSWPDGVLSEKRANDVADRWREALRAIASQVTEHGAGGLTPSDVSLLDISQEEIEEFEADF